MLTAKGTSGITGAGFITVAVVPTIPVVGMALIRGIDRFMSEARAQINIIGNAVDTVVVPCSKIELDMGRINKFFNGSLDEVSNGGKSVAAAA